MGDIYRNCVRTMGASASRDGDDGCVRLRSTLRSGSCQIWGLGSTEYSFDIEEVAVNCRYGRVVNEGLLNTRAWVVEERGLSPRILHYLEIGNALELLMRTFQIAVIRPCKAEHSLSLGFESEDARLLMGFL